MSRRTRQGCIAAALIMLALSGCDRQTTESLVAAANERLAKGEVAAAQVHLKAALQRDPQNAKVRYVLGETLLRSGDPVGAVVELEKAAELKHPEAEVIPMLAKALLAVGKAKQVTDRFGSSEIADTKAAAELKATVAQAFSAQGMLDRTEASIAAALASDPKNITARLLQARWAAGKRDLEGATRLLDALLVDSPRETRAWLMKGALLAAKDRDTGGAEAAFRKALEIDSKYLPAHKALIQLALAQKQNPRYEQAVDDLAKALPSHPETRYFQAQRALFRGDIKAAREISQNLLKSLPNDPGLLHLAGLIELRGGSLVLAETHFTKALQFDPQAEATRRLLAQVHLRNGEPARSLAALQPLIERPNPSPQTLAAAAAAYLQNGQFAQAEAMYARAAKLAPEDTRVRTALAQAQIAKGNRESGLSELEELAEKTDANHADYALISARLQMNDPAGALKAVEHLIAKLPSAPVPHHLKGQMLGRKGDVAGARASFEKAVAADPSFYPAVAALVALDLAEKKQDSAVERLEQHLKRAPRTYLALLALYQLRQASGAKPEAQRALLDDAIRANPAEPAPRLILVDHLLAQRDFGGAKLAAQEGLSMVKDHPGLLNALGRAQLLGGEHQQAVGSFAKIAAAQPESAAAHFRLAEAHAANKDFTAAERSLRRVLEIDPAALEAQRGLIQMAMKDKRFDAGLEIARTVQKQRPAQSVGYLFEGELQAGRKSFDQAITAYRNALARESSPLIATRIYSLLSESGKQAEAAGFGKAWTRDHPKDTIFTAFLGTEAAKANDLVAAEGLFRAVLAVQPDNPSALNALAWITSQQGKPGALELAQRAQKLAPEDAAIMDTLASIHAKEGRLAEALRLQNMALGKAPETAQPKYRLNLAKLQLKAGDQAAARAELDKLAYMGDKFAEHAEVTQLLRTMK